MTSARVSHNFVPGSWTRPTSPDCSAFNVREPASCWALAFFLSISDLRSASLIACCRDCLKHANPAGSFVRIHLPNSRCAGDSPSFLCMLLYSSIACNNPSLLRSPFGLTFLIMTFIDLTPALAYPLLWWFPGEDGSCLMPHFWQNAANSADVPKLRSPDGKKLVDFWGWRTHFEDYSAITCLGADCDLQFRRGILCSAKHEDWTNMWAQGVIDIAEDASVLAERIKMEGISWLVKIWISKLRLARRGQTVWETRSRPDTSTSTRSKWNGPCCASHVRLCLLFPNVSPWEGPSRLWNPWRCVHNCEVLELHDKVSDILNSCSKHAFGRNIPASVDCAMLEKTSCIPAWRTANRKTK